MAALANKYSGPGARESSGAGPGVVGGAGPSAYALGAEDPMVLASVDSLTSLHRRITIQTPVGLEQAHAICSREPFITKKAAPECF